MPQNDDTELEAPVKAAAAAPPAEFTAVAVKAAKLAERRESEQGAALSQHTADIELAYEMFPTPNVPFEEMAPEDRQRWQQKRAAIDSANKKYHDAIRLAGRRHREEAA